MGNGILNKYKIFKTHRLGPQARKKYIRILMPRGKNPLPLLNFLGHSWPWPNVHEGNSLSVWCYSRERESALFQRETSVRE